MSGQLWSSAKSTHLLSWNLVQEMVCFLQNQPNNEADVNSHKAPRDLDTRACLMESTSPWLSNTWPVSWPLLRKFPSYHFDTQKKEWIHFSSLRKEEKNQCTRIKHENRVVICLHRWSKPYILYLYEISVSLLARSDTSLGQGKSFCLSVIVVLHMYWLYYIK